MLGFLIFYIVLNVLIWAHEFGHYGMARLLKLPVQSISIGFGRVCLGRGSLICSDIGVTGDHKLVHHLRETHWLASPACREAIRGDRPSAVP